MSFEKLWPNFSLPTMSLKNRSKQNKSRYDVSSYSHLFIALTLFEFIEFIELSAKKRFAVALFCR